MCVLRLIACGGAPDLPLRIAEKLGGRRDRKKGKIEIEGKMENGTRMKEALTENDIIEKVDGNAWYT